MSPKNQSQSSSNITKTMNNTIEIREQTRQRRNALSEQPEDTHSIVVDAVITKNGIWMTITSCLRVCTSQPLG
jgi:hypothetical protein